MSTQKNLSALEQKAFLELSIDGCIDLSEFTKQVNDICQQAEELQAILFINLTDCSFNVFDSSQTITIQNINKWEQAVRRVERFSGIVITHVSGTITGPAFDLFLATDYRIAKNNARFHVPINKGQIWPSMMIHRLVHQIGMANCRKFLTGLHPFTVNYALSIGLIDQISDDNDIICTIASQLAPMSNETYAISRQLMIEAVTTPYEDALGTHLAACDRELRRLYQWKPLSPRDLNNA